jgi:hypothetical protein
MAFFLMSRAGQAVLWHVFRGQSRIIKVSLVSFDDELGFGLLTGPRYEGSGNDYLA